MFAQCLRNSGSGAIVNLSAQCLRRFTQCLRNVCAMFAQCLRLSADVVVYAVFTQCLLNVCAMFALVPRHTFQVVYVGLRKFTQCLRSVYAVFTQCLRSVYAVFAQVF